MACEAISSGRAVLIVWGTPEMADVGKILGAVDAVVKAHGTPVTYVTRVPRDAEPPYGAVRKAINAAMPMPTVLMTVRSITDCPD